MAGICSHSRTSMNLYNIFKPSKFFLSVFGLWPSQKKTWFTRVRAMGSNVLEFVFCASMALECLHVLNDRTAFLETFTVLASPLAYVIKRLIFQARQQKFIEMYEFINDKDLTNVPQHFRGFIEAPIRFAKALGASYLISCVLTVTMYVVIPVATEKSLPIQFTAFELGRFHAVLYLLQSYSLYEAAANNFSMDMTAVGTMCIIKGQVDVLKEKIRLDSLQSEARMNDCVNHHNKIITLVERAETVFCPLVLVQYLASILVICNVGFQLVLVEVFSFLFLLMMSFLTAMLIQTGMYCWLGNEIILHSLAIRDACYESDWINCDVRVRKTLLIIMERSKRPLHLTAGKFSILSLASFTSIINSAYSFFAVMQRMYN